MSAITRTRVRSVGNGKAMIKFLHHRGLSEVACAEDGSEGLRSSEQHWSKSDVVEKYAESVPIEIHSMTSPESDRTIYLRLTPAEALVLFEWLTRVDAAKNLPVEDPAEEQVLWQLEGQLERVLLEPLGPNYKEAVDAARREVRGSQS